MAIIPQNPFPRIAEDGSVIKGTVPDLNQTLLALASQRFPGRLVVQFNFLMPGEPASPAVIQAAQSLGTLAAFQTNEYLGSSGGGAACSEPVTNPTPCTAATYLALLETGIYPLGLKNALRSQYIEVFPANANAFPADVLQAHDEVLLAQRDLTPPARPDRSPSLVPFHSQSSRGAGIGDAGAAAAPGPPNIILVLTDDQDVQLGSVDYMPNVKALLAQQGTAFPNYYVPLSLCCPSRTTILRGQYPHNTGVLGNSLPDGGFEKVYADKLESATIATLLHNAGYRTVLLGKYLNGYPDTAPDNYIPPGWDEWYSPVKGNPYSEYFYMLNENGNPMTYGGKPADYLTDVIHAKAVDFIKRATAANPSQPLFVYFATYAPHAPYTPAPRHANLFPDVKAPRPPSFNEPDVTGKPDYIKSRPLLTQAEIDGIDGLPRSRAGAPGGGRGGGRRRGDLTATGRLANTYIVFASDNGYHMGEHRLLSGKYTPYETDLHVPLIIRGPGVAAGAVRNQFAANLDLAVTFADLAGVAPQPFSDGRSLKALFATRPSTGWRQAFLLEEFNRGEVIPTDDKFNPASKLGIRGRPDPAGWPRSARRSRATTGSRPRATSTSST